MNPWDNLDDEIRDHLERETREYIDRGMTPEAARAAALRKFGNVARVAEDTRDVWRRVWLEQLAQDLRHGWRLLRRNPRFALVTVGALALGIGINTAVFSVVNGVLLRPLDYPNSNRLVWIADYDPNLRRDFADSSAFAEWRKDSRSYDGMALYGYHQAAMSIAGSYSELTSIYVAGDFWRLTAGHAAVGRLCGAEEHDCVVLSGRYFQRQLGANPALIGGPVLINGRPCHLAGVLTPDFRLQLPMWWLSEHPEPVDAFIPLPPRGETMAQSGFVFALLRAGVPREQALGEIEAINWQLVLQNIVGKPRTRLHIEPLQTKLTSGSQRALLVLLASGGLVLLIACLNVASLLLARAATRRKEIAIRMGIGAGSMRVARQLLTEALMLTFLAAGIGILLAQWGITVLIRAIPYAIPRLDEASIDLRVGAFVCGLALVSALLLAFSSSVSHFRDGLHASLKDGARTAGNGFALPARRVLMTAELAVVIVLLACAGALLQSYWKMMQYPVGFAPAQTVGMKIRFSGPAYRTDAANAEYVARVLNAAETLPGAEQAGVANWVFNGGIPAFPADTDPTVTHVLRVRSVSAGYLPALGIRLLRGAWLPATGPWMLLNETLARQAFGPLDPVGRQFRLRRRSFTVAGVVSDLRYPRLDAAATPEAYVSLEQMPPSFYLEVVARVPRNPETAAEALQKRIAAIDPAQTVYEVKTLEKALADSVAPRRLNLFLLGTFAAVALALALAGVYGVMSYAVAERTREIGVRIALGARREQVIGMVVREAGVAVVIGIAIGLFGAWCGTRAMSSLLYGVSPDDAGVFVSAAALLAAAAVAASIGPAVRASGIDPAAALRAD